MSFSIKQHIEKKFREATSSGDLFDSFQQAIKHKVKDIDLYKILLGNVALTTDEIKMFTDKLCREFEDLKYDIYMWSAKYQRSEIRNINNFKDTYSMNIATLGLMSTIDSQDKYPFPNKGFLIKTSYETAQRFFADVSYTKFYIDYISHLSTLNEIHCFTPRIALGFADQTLPLSQQFSLGGQNSFFGLRDYEFRGRQVLLTSLEYRVKLPVRLFFDTYFKLRYDIGSTWENRDLIRFSDLRHGAGATMSLDTPLGPADFSIGRSFIFNKDISKNALLYGPLLFYFTIGYYY